MVNVYIKNESTIKPLYVQGGGVTGVYLAAADQ